MSTGAQSKAVVAGQHADGPRLLADVGGTNARFALETGPGEITQIRVYPGADYPTITDAIRKYLKDVKISRVNHAAIAIANPVDGEGHDDQPRLELRSRRRAARSASTRCSSSTISPRSRWRCRA